MEDVFIGSGGMTCVVYDSPKSLLIMEEEALAMNRVVKDSLESSMMVVEQVVQNV